jgi:hypothetical protein
MRAKTRHYENDISINQNTIVKIYLDYEKHSNQIDVVDIQFMLYDVDRYDCLDFDYYESDKLVAKTPEEAASMMKKWAKKYCPQDLRLIETKFNLQFFQNFLQDCLLDIE